MTTNVKRMHRDNVLSVLIGPFKFVIPTVSYFVLYPLMIYKSSIEVVGIWSIFAAIVSFISITDIGISQLLTREAGLDRTEGHNDVYADYLSAKRLYIILLALSLTATMILGGNLLSPFATEYPLTALIMSLALILVGAFTQLSGKLDAALLSARHDNYIVQIVSGTAPVLTHLSTIVGATFGMPIEGLAIGTILTGIVSITAYRIRLKRNHRELLAFHRFISLGETIHRISSLIHRGWHLYSSSIGIMLRGPIFRVVIVSTIGLQQAAIFDIAMRLTQTVRDAIASGFSVLYPSFSSLYRSGDRYRIIELIRVSIMILLTLGAFSLGFLMVIVDPFLALWLGEFPPNLVPAVRILAIWQFITLANVPFWYLLQASKNERAAAYSIWAHTTLIILLIPFTQFVNLNIIDMVVYWTLTSVITQGLIYFNVQKRLDLLWVPLLEKQVILSFALAVTYTTSSFLISASVSDAQSLFVTFLYTVIAFLIATSFIIVKPILKFIQMGSK